MRLKRYLSCLLPFYFLMTVPALPAADAPSFNLKNGDTVIFYGDSITAQALYTQWVELYAITRFPQLRIHFLNAGVGGDRVSGGGGGPIDQRLARDVFAHKPTVVTVMLGMNDGSYKATTAEIQSTYLQGYEHLLQSIHANAPAARITLLGPSPFDDVTRPVTFPGGYNSVMRHFADLDRSLASKEGASFIDLNPPVVAALEKARTLDPQMARLIIPDRVHPDTIAHWVMAEALLKGWNAPSLVSSITIDGRQGRLIDVQNATVEHVEREQETLSWRATENSLPLPLNGNNATYGLLMQISDLQQQLNQEPLRVTGLSPGRYALKIDGDGVGTFSAEEFSKGINLADYETPMRSQAQRVAWSLADRSQADSMHLRMLIRKADIGERDGKPDLVQAFEDSLENSMYETAIPKPHTYSLAPAEGPS